MTVLAVPVALVVGLVIGALGGGGAIITVPALVHLLGQSAHQATTSSLVIVGATSLIALLPHARRGNVRVGQGLTFGLLGIAGSIAGSAVSSRISGDALLLLFAALMLLVATLMVRKALAPAADQPDEPSEPMLTLHPLTCACPRVAKVAIPPPPSACSRGCSAWGGFVLVPALVLALSLPMPAAVGTSLLVIAINSATAFTARARTTIEPIDWPLIGAFTAIAILGSLAGARLATRVPLAPRQRSLPDSWSSVGIYTGVTTLA